MHRAPMGLSSLWLSCILEVRIGSLPFFPALCLYVSRGDEKECCHLAPAAVNVGFVEETICVR